MFWKIANLLMASLENAFSTWGNSRDQLCLSTRGCISQSLVAYGHSWWGNASTCAEEKLIPWIASCGKVTFQWKLFSVLINIMDLTDINNFIVNDGSCFFIIYILIWPCHSDQSIHCREQKWKLSLIHKLCTSRPIVLIVLFCLHFYHY